MKKRLSLLSISLWFFVSLAYGQSNSRNSTAVVKRVPHSTNFLVVGDWGRDGRYHQTDVASMMNTDAKTLDADFIVSTGDNFYQFGVDSVSDPQFKTSFEDIYTGPALQKKWFIVLGNHDYMGNVQAEIDYSRISKRWTLPGRYYSETIPLKGGRRSIGLFFTDTSPLMPDYYKEQKYRNVIGQDSAAQLNWLAQKLASSKARWKIVFGHHPVYSDLGYDVPASFRKDYVRLFKKYHVDAYICGHEHNLEYLHPGGHTRYFISGAGSQVEATSNAKYTKFAREISGFLAVSLTDHEMLVRMIDYHGNVLKTVKIEK